MLWQALGATVTLKFYLNGPYALLHSGKVPESNKLSALCACGLGTVYTDYPNNKEQEFMLNYSKLQRSSFACLFACLSVCLKLSISHFKNNRAFSSGSGNLAEGSSTGHEHGNLSSITEYFH